MPELEFKGWLENGYETLGFSSAVDSCRYLSFDIGEKRRKGADNFGLLVGTPEGILAHHQSADRKTVERMMVIREWSLPDIKNAIETIVRRSSFRISSWSACCEELQRFFGYEYEDYNINVRNLPSLPLIRDIRSDTEHLQSWVPLDAQSTFAEVLITVSDSDNKNNALLSLSVATPAGLRVKEKTSFVLSDRTLILQDEFNFYALEETLTETMEYCRGNDWRDALSRLSRYFNLTQNETLSHSQGSR